MTVAWPNMRAVNLQRDELKLWWWTTVLVGASAVSVAIGSDDVRWGGGFGFALCAALLAVAGVGCREVLAIG
jgi:hypothetical protein